MNNPTPEQRPKDGNASELVGDPRQTPTTNSVRGRNDVEKRWTNGPEVRSATIFTLAVSVAAVLATVLIAISAGRHSEECADAAFAICANPERNLLAILPPAILLFGGLAAFVQTYRAWRAAKAWPVWQGAGWFLFIFMTIYLGFASQALLAR